MSNEGEISWGLHSSLERERKIRRRLFTSSIKREIRHFHVEFVQWWPRIVQKSVLHVQSCFLLNQPIAFLPFECFHSRGQHLCKFIGAKESVCIRKEFNFQRISLGHQMTWQKPETALEKSLAPRVPTWPPFHCFGTPIWPPWPHVKTLHKDNCTMT